MIVYFNSSNGRALFGKLEWAPLVYNNGHHINDCYMAENREWLFDKYSTV